MNTRPNTLLEKVDDGSFVYVYYDEIGPCSPLVEMLANVYQCEASRLGHHSKHDCAYNFLAVYLSPFKGWWTHMESRDKAYCRYRVQWLTQGNAALHG